MSMLKICWATGSKIAKFDDFICCSAAVIIILIIMVWHLE